MAHTTVELNGEDYSFDWPADTTLLSAMLDAGIPAPHSCTMGQCGACQCTLEGGESHMDNNAVLDDYDVADDQRLACQTKRDSEGPYEVSYLF